MYDCGGVFVSGGGVNLTSGQLWERGLQAEDRASEGPQVWAVVRVSRASPALVQVLAVPGPECWPDRGLCSATNVVCPPSWEPPWQHCLSHPVGKPHSDSANGWQLCSGASARPAEPGAWDPSEEGSLLTHLFFPSLTDVY